MKCSKCSNVIDKVDRYTILNNKGESIGVTCRFCGFNHFKKKKAKKLPEKEIPEMVIDNDEYD